MNHIAKKKLYTIEINLLKNRIYLTIVGYWENPDTVPHYLSDLEKATWDLNPGFTILTDATQLKTPPDAVTALHIEAQKMLITAGLKATAEIVGPDVIGQMALNGFSGKSGMEKRSFDNQYDAEAWLDVILKNDM